MCILCLREVVMSWLLYLTELSRNCAVDLCVQKSCLTHEIRMQIVNPSNSESVNPKDIIMLTEWLIRHIGYAFQSHWFKVKTSGSRDAPDFWEWWYSLTHKCAVQSASSILCLALTQSFTVSEYTSSSSPCPLPSPYSPPLYAWLYPHPNTCTHKLFWSPLLYASHPTQHRASILCNSVYCIQTDTTLSVPPICVHNCTPIIRSSCFAWCCGCIKRIASQ